MPGPDRRPVPVAPADEAGEVRTPSRPRVGLGQPAAVLPEHQVPVHGQVDLVHGCPGHQRAVVGRQGAREAVVGGERGELLLRGDLRTAAHGVQQPVLLRGVADHQVHLAGRSRRTRRQRVGRQSRHARHRSVDRRIVVAVPRPGVPPVALGDPVRSLDEGLRGGRGQPGVRGGDTGGRGDLRRGAGGGLRGGAGVHGAVGEGAAEQAARRVHRHEAGDRGRSGGLSRHRDPAGIAAERGDVVAHPPERGDLVEQSTVVRPGFLTVRGRDVAESLEAEAVVEGDDHDSVTGQERPVEVGLCGGTEDVGAAVDPHEHGEPPAVAVRGPDVEAQDVLVAR